MLIHRMGCQHILAAARVHARAFPRQRQSEDWLKCNLAALPRVQGFVAEDEGCVRGFILWIQKSGFRGEVVLELEQIAVDPDAQGRGIAQLLICESLVMIAGALADTNARIKTVIISTRQDNPAQRLYRKVLGAEIAAVIPDLYSGAEVLMVSRDPLRSVAQALSRLRSGTKSAA